MKLKDYTDAVLMAAQIAERARVALVAATTASRAAAQRYQIDQAITAVAVRAELVPALKALGWTLVTDRLRMDPESVTADNYKEIIDEWLPLSFTRHEVEVLFYYVFDVGASSSDVLTAEYFYSRVTLRMNSTIDGVVTQRSTEFRCPIHEIVQHVVDGVTKLTA